MHASIRSSLIVDIKRQSALVWLVESFALRKLFTREMQTHPKQFYKAARASRSGQILLYIMSGVAK